MVNRSFLSAILQVLKINHSTLPAVSEDRATVLMSVLKPDGNNLSIIVMPEIEIAVRCLSSPSSVLSMPRPHRLPDINPRLKY